MRLSSLKMSNSDEIVQWNIQVFGTVQGVCLRYMVVKRAHRLHIYGFVQNKDDGSVEASLQGTLRQLTAFEQWLHSNPGNAVISRFLKRSVIPKPFDDFQIRY